MQTYTVTSKLGRLFQKDIIKTRLTIANFHAKKPGMSVLQLLPKDVVPDELKYLQKYRQYDGQLMLL